MTDLRDRCCFKRCRQPSSIIFMGAGLCDGHWEQTCSVYKPSYDYLLPRVIPEARSEMEYRHKHPTHTTHTTP